MRVTAGGKGYAKKNDKESVEYEVTHPRWLKYTVKDFDLFVDYKLTYGNKFEFLNNLMPVSVMLAEGSEITVESAKTLK